MDGFLSAKGRRFSMAQSLVCVPLRSLTKKDRPFPQIRTGAHMTTTAINLTLLAKVNHTLAAAGERQVKRCPPDNERFQELGALYLLDMASGEVLDHHLDIAVVARDLGVA
jgi:hypothetical protein